MAALRFLAALFALVAVLALVSDATPSVQKQDAFAPTSFEAHWKALSPKTLESTQANLSQSLPPTVWKVLKSTVLAMPTFLLFGLLAAIFGYAGRHRHRINVYVN